MPSVSSCSAKSISLSGPTSLFELFTGRPLELHAAIYCFMMLVLCPITLLARYLPRTQYPRQPVSLHKNLRNPLTGDLPEPNTDPEQEFAYLLQQAALGVESAQQAISQKYADQIRAVARVLLGPQLRQHLDTMDLVQSVHHSILIGLRQQRFQFSSSDKLIALACAILRRKVAKKWRRHRRQLTLTSGTAHDSQQLVDVLSSITNHETSPSLIAQFNDQLVKVCSHLGETERVMLEMRLDGYTSQEIAKRLDLHPVALRVRWTRLRRKLADFGINESLI